jgi:Ca-activated chloride channel family protein
MSYAIDPYEILGLPSSANSADINKAYERLAARLDPKRNPYPSAASQYLVISDAYKIISDPVGKRRYDEFIHAQPDTEKNKPVFSMRVTPSKRSVKPLPEEQVIYLLAELTAPPQAVEMMQKREVRLNVTLVIDQSKSMDDEQRMERVKAAAQAIITELTNQDVLSVVSFNDRASIVIPATPVQDKMAMRARIGMIQPMGGTEIYKGLLEGVNQTRKYLSPQMVNHIILLTDGRTFGDEEKALDLAKKAADQGISISAMGLGSDWNDKFLDQLASSTGGTSTFIKSVNMVQKFMDEQLRSLSNAFAERLTLLISPDSDVQLEMAFKLSPHPQPLAHEGGVVPLAGMQPNRPISILLQLQLPAAMNIGKRSLVHVMASGDIMVNQAKPHKTTSDITIDVAEKSVTEDAPPASIVDALSKLTLYRLQEKAQEAIDEGNFEEATRRLQYLGTRLIDMGEEELGRQAMSEAAMVQHTHAFSNEASKKTIKYQTRSLISGAGMKEALTNLFSSDES